MGPLPPPNPDPQKPDKQCWHNTIASFMSRHIRHIHARSNEWYRVHRAGGHRGGGGMPPWLSLLLWLGAILLAVGVVQVIVEILKAIFPWLLGLGLVAAIVWFIIRSQRTKP